MDIEKAYQERVVAKREESHSRKSARLEEAKAKHKNDSDEALEWYVDRWTARANVATIAVFCTAIALTLFSVAIVLTKSVNIAEFVFGVSDNIFLVVLAAIVILIIFNTCVWWLTLRIDFVKLFYKHNSALIEFARRSYHSE